VFTVDVAEGQPPLKLPYNMTEDPWVAAQKFITKHGLPQTYLEEVRNFIVENSQSVSMSQLDRNTSYRDPFTGDAPLQISVYVSYSPLSICESSLLFQQNYV